MKFVLLVCLFFLNVYVYGQRIEESFFMPVDGLKTKKVYCVTEDKAGYIWIGTDAGVARYDGNEFLYFTTADGLSDNEVFQVHEDRRGRLWFLTYSGKISIYDHGRILNETNTFFLRQLYPGGMSRGWMERGDSIWYIANRQAYLIINDRLSRVETASSLFNSPDAVFADLVCYGNRFVLVSNKGYYFPASDNRVQFPAGQSFLPVGKTILLQDELYYYAANVLICYSFSRQKFETFPFPQRGESCALYYDANDNYLLVATERMVYAFNLVTKKFEPHLQTGIPFLCYLFRDSNKRLWAGSQNQGLFLYRPVAVHRYLPVTQLGTAAAYSIGSLNGRIYAGYINGEFFKWSGGVASWLNTGIAAGLGKTYGFVKMDNSLWAISGTALINMQTGHHISCPGSVKAMAVQGEKAYLGMSFSVQQLSHNSLYRLGVTTNLSEWSTMVYDKRVNSLLVSGDSLFIGSAEGLRLLVNDIPVSLTHYGADLTDTRVTKVIKDADGRILFATAGKGIGILNGKHCYQVSVREGLAGNNCNSIVRAGDSAIWVATDRGISKVILKWQGNMLKTNVQNISVSEGLPDQMVNDVLVAGDTIWVATQSGVAWFKEQELAPGPLPAVQIQEVWVNGERVSFIAPLQLTHRQNNLRIDFSAFRFGLPEQVYAYRLIGADTGWIQGYSRRIQYSSLAPGHYRFQVMTGQPGMQRSSAIQELVVHIKPPFWRRPWIILLLMFTIIILIGLVVYRRIRYIRHRHEQQQQFLRWEKERLELEQKAAALQMNPHFVFNAMNAIRGYYSTGDMEGGHQYINHFARLMRLILEKNAQSLISLSDEITLLQHYLELMSLNYPGKWEWHISNETNADPATILFPPMLIQPFVENAVLHGVASLERKGKIAISFGIINNKLTCCIEDNGIGIHKATGKNTYKAKPSLGIAITRQRLELLGNYILDISDKALADDFTTGTVVRVGFPVTINKT